MDAWIFYTLGYNPIVCYLFCCSVFLALALGAFQSTLVSLWHTCIIFFLKHFLTFWHKKLLIKIVPDFPVGLFLLAHISLWHTLSFCFVLILTLSFWHYKMLHAHLVYFCLKPQNHFPKVPLFLSLVYNIKYQDLSARCTCCYKGVIAFSLSTDRAETHMCVS